MRLVRVPNEVSNQLNEGLQAAGATARRGAHAAYRVALDHPRASTAAGIILAAALVGGVLWLMFGDSRRPVERRRKGQRVRAVSERRSRRGRAAATA